MQCYLTHLGTATVLLEIGPLRFLTDPALDSVGAPHIFKSLGVRLHLKRLTNPVFPIDGINQIDAVLLSHDQHADNLDDTGRALLPLAGKVLTTRSGANRLGGNAVGLKPWAATEIMSVDGFRVRVTATPARHGPPGSQPMVGEVIGFTLEWEGQQHGAVYISGDTVWFRGVAEVGKRFRVGTAVLHLGAAGFKRTGPLRYTFNGTEAARAAQALGARTVIPIHYDDWQHFREPRALAESAFAAAALSDRVHWLPLGARTEIEI